GQDLPAFHHPVFWCKHSPLKPLQMKLKRSYHITIILLLVLVTACKEGFLDRRPLNQISEPEFWKTTSDLEVYLNNLYGALPQWGSHDAGPYWKDNNSDNMVPGLYNLR